MKNKLPTKDLVQLTESDMRTLGRQSPLVKLVQILACWVCRSHLCPEEVCALITGDFGKGYLDFSLQFYMVRK